jgi:hypothetical protein
LHWGKLLNDRHLYAADQPSIEKSVIQPISSQFHKVFNYSKVELVLSVTASDTAA